MIINLFVHLKLLRIDLEITISYEVICGIVLNSMFYIYRPKTMKLKSEFGFVTKYLK